MARQAASPEHPRGSQALSLMMISWTPPPDGTVALTRNAAISTGGAPAVDARRLLPTIYSPAPARRRRKALDARAPAWAPQRRGCAVE